MTNKFELCGTCAYYAKDPKKDKEGSCHRFPPQVTPIVIGHKEVPMLDVPGLGTPAITQPMIQIHSMYPPVGEKSIGCFEHEPMASYVISCSMCGTKEAVEEEPSYTICPKCNGPINVTEI